MKCPTCGQRFVTSNIVPDREVKVTWGTRNVVPDKARDLKIAERVRDAALKSFFGYCQQCDNVLGHVIHAIKGVDLTKIISDVDKELEGER